MIYIWHKFHIDKIPLQLPHAITISGFLHDSSILPAQPAKSGLLLSRPVVNGEPEFLYRIVWIVYIQSSTSVVSFSWLGIHTQWEWLHSHLDLQFLFAFRFPFWILAKLTAGSWASPDVAAGARQVPPGALHLTSGEKSHIENRFLFAPVMYYIKYYCIKCSPQKKEEKKKYIYIYIYTLGNQNLQKLLLICCKIGINHPWPLFCCHPSPPFYPAASRRTPVVIKKLPPTPLRSRWKGRVQTCYLENKMSTSPSTSCFMLSLNIKNWWCRLNTLTSC